MELWTAFQKTKPPPSQTSTGQNTRLAGWIVGGKNLNPEFIAKQAHSQSLIVMIYRIVSTLFINSIAVDKLSWKDMPDIRYKLMPMPGSILMEQCPSEYDRNNWSSGG